MKKFKKKFEKAWEILNYRIFEEISKKNTRKFWVNNR